MPSLALAMIAKDEERSLPSALASVAGLVDEIVVAVDAATRDGTREVVRQAHPSALLFDVPFQDFAQMRNAALSQVTCDWILVLDADETLEGDPRPLLARPAIWEFPRHHWADFARTVPAADDRYYPDWQCRLFPNRRRIRFERPVHEVPRGLPRIRTEQATIHHFKEALRAPEMLAERRALYADLVRKGLAAGFRYRRGKDY